MSSTIERATLTAPDISCDHCVATVKRAVGGLVGVISVDADHASKQVDVSFDPQRVSLDQIETTLSAAGYPAQR